jgi:hypothetical protein
MAYCLIWKESGTILNFSGDLSIKEINEANGFLHGNYRIESHRYTIWDLLGANLSSITEDEIDIPAAIDMPAARYVRKIKVLLVVQEAHATQLCKRYIKTASELISNWEFAIFNSMADAKKWIDS